MCLDRGSAVGYTNASFFVPDEIPPFIERCAANARSAVNQTLRCRWAGRAGAVLTAAEPESADISQGVTEGEGLHKEQGAGDQGLMFGFACDETAEQMPLPIALAHRLMENLSKLRHQGKADFLLPDGKSQVSVRYAGGRPVEVSTVVVSAQHRREVGHATVREAVIEELIKPTIPKQFLTKDTVIHVNPTVSV